MMRKLIVIAIVALAIVCAGCKAVELFDGIVGTDYAERPVTADEIGEAVQDAAVPIARDVATGMSTGNWIPLLTMAAGAIWALIERRRRSAAARQLNDSREVTDTQDKMIDAMILGVHDLGERLGDGTTARNVAKAIKHAAKAAGVQDGPYGLRDRVEVLDANVLSDEG